VFAAWRSGRPLFVQESAVTMWEYPEDWRPDRDRSPEPARDPDRARWERFEEGWRRYEGEAAAQAAVRLGFLGLFVFGIVLGPMALVRVWRADTFGVRADLGEILGWMASLVGLVHISVAYLLLSL